MYICPDSSKNGAQGIPFVSGLALQNCRDLLPMLQWNVEHDIRFMRCASFVLPQKLTGSSYE